MMQGLVSAAARPPARGPLPSPGGASKQANGRMPLAPPGAPVASAVAGLVINGLRLSPQKFFS